MKYIISICILFSSILLSKDIKDNIEYKNSAIIDLRYTTGSKISSGDLEVILYNDFFIGDNHRLTITPGIKGYTVNEKGGNTNSTVKLFYLDEFYYSYSLTNNLSFSIGQFSARNGWLSLASGRNNTMGIGLYGLSDASMQGLVLTYKVDSLTVNAYAVAFNKYIKTYFINDTAGDYKEHTDKTKGTSGIGLVSQYTIDDRNKAYLQLHHICEKYDSDTLNNAYTVSLGYLWDDISYSGLRAYGVASITFNNRNMDNYRVKAMYTKKNSIGYFIMVGLNYQIEELLFGKEGEVGFEYSYSSKNQPKNMSLRYIYPGKHSESGHQFLAYTGIKLDNRTSVRFKYIYHNSNNQNPEVNFRERAKSMEKYNAFQVQFLYNF